MNTKSLPEARRRWIAVAVQVLLIAAGVAVLSIGIAGHLEIVVMDAVAELFFLVLGIAMIFTGIFRVNLIELVV